MLYCKALRLLRGTSFPTLIEKKMKVLSSGIKCQAVFVAIPVMTYNYYCHLRRAGHRDHIICTARGSLPEDHA